MNRIRLFLLALLLFVGPVLSGCAGDDDGPTMQVRSGAEWAYEGPPGLNLTLRLLAGQELIASDRDDWAIEYELWIKDEVKATIVEFIDPAAGTTLGWKNDCNIIVQRPDRELPSCFRDRVRWAFVGAGLPAFMGTAPWLNGLRGERPDRQIETDSEGCLTIPRLNQSEQNRSLFWAFAQNVVLCPGEFAPQRFKAPVPAFLSRTQDVVEFERVAVTPGRGLPFGGFGQQEKTTASVSNERRLAPFDGAAADLPVDAERANRDASNLSDAYREITAAGGRLSEYQYFSSGRFSTGFGLVDGDSSRVIIAVRNEDRGHRVVLEYERTGPEELRRASLAEESSIPGGAAPGSVHTLSDALERFHALGLPADDEYQQAAWRPSGSVSLDIFIIGEPSSDVELAWGVRHQNARVEEGAVAFFPLEGVERGDGELLIFDQPL